MLATFVRHRPARGLVAESGASGGSATIAVNTDVPTAGVTVDVSADLGGSPVVGSSRLVATGDSAASSATLFTGSPITSTPAAAVGLPATLTPGGPCCG
jgi:hypothetical protein